MFAQQIEPANPNHTRPSTTAVSRYTIAPTTGFLYNISLWAGHPRHTIAVTTSPYTRIAPSSVGQRATCPIYVRPCDMLSFTGKERRVCRVLLEHRRMPAIRACMFTCLLYHQRKCLPYGIIHTTYNRKRFCHQTAGYGSYLSILIMTFFC